ncbi:MAG: Gfo/Idh/MocA family protein [Thermomicrobiales bacterium]
MSSVIAGDLPGLLEPLTPPVAIGSVGLGGYAGTICRLLEEQSHGDNPPVRLLAVYEPDVATHGDRLQALRAAGVQTPGSYEELLALPIEAVWLPVPIELHRPFTEQALAAGKTVMCEKPVVGSVDDLALLRAARDRAGLPLAVGFQDMYDPATHIVKQRLLAGALGTIQSATLLACWPRGRKYFTRNAWAGRLRRNDTWVLDSPLSNALSHYVNLLLFWLGATPAAPATPVSVAAELYRANDIENFDTCSLRVQLAGGATMLVLLTHACQETINPLITITGDGGTLETVHQQHVTLRDRQGQVSEEILLSTQLRPEMVRRFAGRVRGVLDDSAIATLEEAEAHLIVVNGTAEAAPVQPFPAGVVTTVSGRDGDTIRAVPGIEQVFTACARQGQLPSESGLVAWSVPPGQRDLSGYHHFAGPARVGSRE